MDELESRNRYQVQPWYIKLWRRRWYLVIPYWTIKSWLNSNNHNSNFKFLWGLYIGLAQSHMRWYYTMEEIKARLEERKKEWQAKNSNNT